ncbi:MAG TPA: helix-turn-helix domain-containing protein [Candidatus Saccharimonadales bacterium]|nr:helix-turn-helix domain-containing protein [Candidatus Saccharimonadales bacterium]
MTYFTPKKLISEDSIGEELRRLRTFKNLGVDEVSQKLGIRSDYLLALEEENFNSLPAGLYGKNFLKKYADFLGADKNLVAKFLQEASDDRIENNPFSQKILKKNKFLIFPKIVRNLLLSLAVLICFLYLIFYFKKIVLPPNLIVSQPGKNLMITESSILIAGKTEKEAEVRINGELILNNNDGDFSQMINLKKGVNTLIISSKKKYSQENIILRQILVE